MPVRCAAFFFARTPFVAAFVGVFCYACVLGAPGLPDESAGVPSRIEVMGGAGYCEDEVEIVVVVEHGDLLDTLGFDVDYDVDCAEFVRGEAGKSLEEWAVFRVSVVSAGRLRVGGFAGDAAPLDCGGGVAVARLVFRVAGGAGCPCAGWLIPSLAVDGLSEAELLGATVSLEVRPTPTPLPSPSVTSSPTPSPTASPSPLPTPGPAVDSDGDGYADWYEEYRGSDAFSPDSRPLLGDLDGDGVATIFDALLLHRSIGLGVGSPGGGAPAERGDVNVDGWITLDDACLLYGWSIGHAECPMLPAYSESVGVSCFPEILHDHPF